MGWARKSFGCGQSWPTHQCRPLITRISYLDQVAQRLTFVIANDSDGMEAVQVKN